MREISLYEAIECFLEGFVETRRASRPCNVTALEQNIWLVSDPPHHKLAPRNSEIVTLLDSPATLPNIVHKHRIRRHFVSAFVEDPADSMEHIVLHKAMGYRLLGREPIFVVSTAIEQKQSQCDIRRIVEATAAAEIAKVARKRQIPEKYLTDGPERVRLYAAYIEGKPVGWVRSVSTGNGCAYVSNLFVSKEHRRKGIGKSLMSEMLTDDNKFGIEWSVLLSSKTGAMLYPVLGYEQRGLLMLFAAPKAAHTHTQV